MVSRQLFIVLFEGLLSGNSVFLLIRLLSCFRLNVHPLAGNYKSIFLKLTNFVPDTNIMDVPYFCEPAMKQQTKLSVK